MRRRLKYCLTIKDRRELRALAVMYAVRITFYTFNDQRMGGCIESDNLILINDAHLFTTRDEIFSTFFHELGHIYCYITGKWKAYHLWKKKFTKNEKRAALLTAFKAEVWVDKWAEKEMGKVYPHMKFDKTYSDRRHAKRIKKWMHDNSLMWCK